MKKKGLIAITMLATLVLAGTSIITSKAAVVRPVMKTYTTSAGLCKEVKKCYNDGEDGPLMIVKGTLNNNGQETEVYLVCLGGTENVEGQSTNIVSDIKAAFELSSDYKVNVENTMLKNIPTGSNIILAGHSLGGMIAQQLSSDEEVKRSFNVLRTITYGSPLVSPYNKEGEVKRFVDKGDVVPYCSMSNLIHSVTHNYDYQINYAESDFDSVVETHKKSYRTEEVWEGYDFLGDMNGDASFKFDVAAKEYYQCPVF